MTTATHRRPHVEAWIREPAPFGAHEAVEGVLERLRDLTAEGAIADADVKCWGARVRQSGPDPTGATDALATFDDWAEADGVDLGPAIEERTVTSSLVEDEPRDVVVLPIVCLAVYDAADDLRAVFPHATDDGVRSVHDGLDDLEAGTFGTTDSEGAGQGLARARAASVPSHPGQPQGRQ